MGGERETISVDHMASILILPSECVSGGSGVKGLGGRGGGEE